MSKTENVTLKVRAAASSGDGWTNTTASNGQVYSFKYTGGDGNTGNMKTKVGDGAATLTVNVDTDQRYSINNVNFTGDVYNQMSLGPLLGASVDINDANTEVEEVTYCVQVSDSQANGATIPCDPMITNDPRPPTARIMHMRQ